MDRRRLAAGLRRRSLGYPSHLRSRSRRACGHASAIPVWGYARGPQPQLRCHSEPERFSTRGAEPKALPERMVHPVARGGTRQSRDGSYDRIGIARSRLDAFGLIFVFCSPTLCWFGVLFIRQLIGQPGVEGECSGRSDGCGSLLCPRHLIGTGYAH